MVLIDNTYVPNSYSNKKFRANDISRRQLSIQVALVAAARLTPRLNSVYSLSFIVRRILF